MIDFNAIQVVLNQTFASPVADQLNNRVQILRTLKKTIGGGKNISWPVKVAANYQAASYASGAVINSGASVTNTRVPAVLQWALNKAEFSVAGDALAIAATSGPEALANLFKDEVMGAGRDLAVSLATQLYAAKVQSTDIDGFGVALTNTGTYATINRATYSAWQANYYANGGVGRALTKAMLDQGERDCFANSGFTPDLIITTPTLINSYEGLFTSIQRQNTDQPYDIAPRLSDIHYRGIPVIRDARCPAGALFMLTLDSMEFEQLPPLTTADGISLVAGTEPLMDPDGNVGLQVTIELLGKTGDKVDGFIKCYNNLVVKHPNMNAVIKDLQ
jgi:hypothetical protein